MQAFKNFMLYYGEKLVLALVLVLCGLNVFRNIGSSPYDLTMPDDSIVTIDPNAYQSRITEVKEVLNKGDAIRGKPEAERISWQLIMRIFSGNATYLQLDSEEWYAYAQPTPIGIPQTFREVRAEDSGGISANIPPAFRTRLGNPQNITTRAALGQVIITARDNPALNFPAAGSRRMLLYRKAIGSPQAELSSKIRTQMLVAPHVPIVAEKSESEAAETAKTEITSLGDAYRRARTGQPAEPTPVITEKKELDLEQYKFDFNQMDRAADEELTVLTGNNDGLLLETAWELVSDNMYVVRGSELTDDDYTELFAEGLNPEIVVMGETELAQYNEQRRKETKVSTAAPIVSSSMASRRQRIDDLAAVRTSATAATSRTDADAISLQSYVFIDKTVKENMIYRYAVVAAVKPQYPTDQQALEQIRTQNWDIYCELVGVDKVGSFAPPQRSLVGALYEDSVTDEVGERRDFVLKKEIFNKHYGLASPHLLDYIKPAYDTAVNSDFYASNANRRGVGADVTTNGPAARSLRNEKNRLTPIGWAYKNMEWCFSDFVCGQLVVTPQEYDFSLQAVTGVPNEPTARVEVFKTLPTGEVLSSSFFVRPPEFVRPLVRRDLLVKDGKGNVIEPVQLLPLVDVYNTTEMLRVRPTLLGGRAYAKVTLPTGEKSGKGAVNREDVDFEPNWGLLEIRPYKIRQRIYSLDRRGEWKVSSENFLPSIEPMNNYYALIIGEIRVEAGQQRRVRRLFRPLTRRQDTESKRYEYEYIWEFDIYQRAMERSAKTKKPTD